MSCLKRDVERNNLDAFSMLLQTKKCWIEARNFLIFRQMHRSNKKNTAMGMRSKYINYKYTRKEWLQ